MYKNPIPPITWEQILQQAMYEGYLSQLDQLIDQKARYWEALEAQDRFQLSGQENQRLQKRMDALASEIQVLDNIRHAIPDLAQLYYRHLNRQQEVIQELLHVIEACTNSEKKTIEILIATAKNVAA